MDASEASYCIEKKKIKVAKWGTHKKNNDNKLQKFLTKLEKGGGGMLGVEKVKTNSAVRNYQNEVRFILQMGKIISKKVGFIQRSSS
jgi:hypothetical protein